MGVKPGTFFGYPSEGRAGTWRVSPPQPRPQILDTNPLARSRPLTLSQGMGDPFPNGDSPPTNGWDGGGDGINSPHRGGGTPPRPRPRCQPYSRMCFEDEPRKKLWWACDTLVKERYMNELRLHPNEMDLVDMKVWLIKA